MKKYGLTLSLKKCRFAQSQARFCGEIIGSGKRFTDPEKLQVVQELVSSSLTSLFSTNMAISETKVVQEMKPPTAKTEVKRILGFFSYFRDQTKDFANVTQPLTDLTSKKYSGKNPLGRVAATKF